MKNIFEFQNSRNFWSFGSCTQPRPWHMIVPFWSWNLSGTTHLSSHKTNLKSMRLLVVLDKSALAYWALLGPSWSFWVNFFWPYLALLKFFWPYQALLRIIGPYWALLDLKGPYWSLRGLTGPYRAFTGPFLIWWLTDWLTDERTLRLIWLLSQPKIHTSEFPRGVGHRVRNG